MTEGVGRAGEQRGEGRAAQEAGEKEKKGAGPKGVAGEGEAAGEKVPGAAAEL